MPDTHTSTSPEHIVVIGAGVMGAGVAWRCAARGARVTLLDRPRTGHEASWAAAGMLAPYSEVEFYEDDLLALGEESQQLWPAFAEALETASGHDIGYDRSGSLVVAVDRDESEAIARLYAYQHARGLPVERLSGDACREREPLLAPRVHSGVWSPDDHQVDAQRLVEALRAAAVSAGAELRQTAPVATVHVEAGAAIGVSLDDGTRIAASHVVIAAGAWAKSLDGLQRADRPRVRPVKGQMLALTRDPSLTLTHVIRAPRVYIVPKSDRWVVGATSEDRGFDGRVTAGGVWELLDAVYEVVPAGMELELASTWTGFRPASRDNGPLLGVSPRIAGLAYCNGHYRNGIQQTPVSVNAVAASLFGDPVSAAVRAFTPARFDA